MVQDVVLSGYALDIFTDRPKGRGIVSSALENHDIRFEKTHFVQEQLDLQIATKVDAVTRSSRLRCILRDPLVEVRQSDVGKGTAVSPGEYAGLAG